MSHESLNFHIENYSNVTDKISDFISYQIKSRKKKGVVIGLSGGIDSSVCLVLALYAIGNKRTHGLFLPEKGVAPKMDIYNVRYLARSFKIKYKEIQINRGKKFYRHRYGKKD